MSINTRFAKSKDINIITPLESKKDWHAKLKTWKDNADNKEVFGGKRFLGLNKNGSEVWISYELRKDNKQLTISSTHNLSALENDGAKLAPRRVTVGLNKTAPDDLMRPSTQKDMGVITPNTLRYINKLRDMADMGIGKVNGQCSSQLFMLVSNTIYEGDTETDKGDCRWNDIIEAWDLPPGKYLTVYG